MALLLTLDTATEYAGVGLYEGKQRIGLRENKDLKNHASFIQPAIKTLLAELKIPLAKLDAVAVTAGPGSYTGLRVGLSTAKGLCYALDKPLILVNTLEAMAWAAIQEIKDTSALYVPAIDARRNEVFAAVYTSPLDTVSPAQPLVLGPESFQEELAGHRVFFSGTGASKIKKALQNANAFYSDIVHSVDDVNYLAWKKWEQKDFSDVAYSQPSYFKAFYTTAKKIQ